MDTKVYLDTNIILDLFDNERHFSKSSIALIDELFQEGSDFYINSDTLTNTFFILKSRKKVSQEAALDALEKITAFCEIVPLEKSDAQKAINLCKDSEIPCIDYEDTVQYVCAKKIEADLIVTNDKGFVSLDIKTRQTT